MSNEDQLLRRKLGPIVSKDEFDGTTPVVIEALDDGEHELGIYDANAVVLQGKASVLSALNATQLRALGRRVLAGERVEFNVDPNQDAVAIVGKTGSDSGEYELSSNDKGKTA